MPRSGTRERNGDYLAYTVFGAGSHDLAVMQSRTPIDLMWELPQLAAFMEALGRMARVIVWDARGAGASDPIRDPSNSTNESTVDDIATVLDAAAADRVTLFDANGGPSTIYAATYPERVRSLILLNLRVSFPSFTNMSDAQRKRLAIKLKRADILNVENPRVAHDPVLRRWWERAGRLQNSPEAMARHLEVAGHVNYESIFPGVQHPALVLHRRDNRIWDLETSRAAAAMIPGARFVELPGSENDIFLGDTAPVLAEIEQFLAEPEVDIESDRQLATVLFTDIVSSTERLAERGDDAWRRILDDLDRTMDRIVTAHRGRVVKQTGDGILATFDGPARAVHCAAAMLDAAQELGVTLRAGLHTGEIELRPPDIAGIAVHIASRVADLAGPGEILVSRTVVDLTAGSGLAIRATRRPRAQGRSRHLADLLRPHIDLNIAANAPLGARSTSASGDVFERLDLPSLKHDAGDEVAVRQHVQLALELPTILQHHQGYPTALRNHRHGRRYRGPTTTVTVSSRSGDAGRGRALDTGGNLHGAT